MSEARLIGVTDHGMWRGHHTWTIVLEDERGRSSVNARGDDEDQAVAHARQTFADRRHLTEEEKASMRAINQHLGETLG